MDPLNIPELLRRYGLRPDKGLGQNFLIDEGALQRVAAAADIQPSETVLEIGPGLGSLTRHLAQYARRVVAVELDGALLPPLKEVLSPFANVCIIHGDILQQDPAALVAEADQPPYGCRVVANIPYYITSAVIRHLLESRLPVRKIVLTIQREVAERITSGPGDLSLLALSVIVYGRPQIVGHIPAGAFFPPPKVDSAIIAIDLYPQPRIPANQLDDFFRLAKAGFSQKRKTLRNALSGGLAWSPEKARAVLETAGIDPRRRAETLSLEEWQALLNAALPPAQK